jgi:transcriptional regulator with XRE-family HTH domain
VAIGEWLKAELQERGLTMSAFAHQVGVSQPTVSKWIAGKTTPDGVSALRISGALGVPLSEVYGRVGGDDPWLEEVQQVRYQLNALRTEREEILESQERMKRRLEEVHEEVRSLERQMILLIRRQPALPMPAGGDVPAAGMVLLPADPSDLGMPDEVRKAYMTGFHVGLDVGRRVAQGEVTLDRRHDTAADLPEKDVES